MLRITTEQKKGKVVLTVEGRLAGPWVGTLEHSWRDARANNEKVCVNLCGVSFIDPAGKTLLKEIHHQGGLLTAQGCLNQAIIREIGAEAGKKRSEGGEGESGNGNKGSHIVFYTLLFGLLFEPEHRPRAIEQAERIAAASTDAECAVDAGTGGQPGGEAEHDGADRADRGEAKRRTEKHRARGIAAAGEPERRRRMAAHQPSRGIRRRRFSRSSAGHDFSRPHRTVRACFRRALASTGKFSI